MTRSDVIVVGAGHAGCEAALAIARMGGRVLLLTMDLDAVALMPCNPAIGGLAKGQLVREIDALGGEMAHAIDQTGIQFRRLNTSKGPAVRSNRAQADKDAYRRRMRHALDAAPGLELRQASVDALWVEPGRLLGVITSQGERLAAPAVILTTGTFLRGLVHVGLEHHPAGRVGEPPAQHLSASLAAIGLELGRLKTGTPPRLDRDSIDFSRLQTQLGDPRPQPFSFDTDAITSPQVPCWITRTNPQTHDLIRAGLDRSPLYRGVIKGVGPRYCPSIEDKVVRFADRPSHVVFLEPEGLGAAEIYPNGVSTSLPLDVQQRMINSITGLERARIVRPGYAVEYDYVDPQQLLPSLETKALPGLFHAGQINGTSGYEEAAAQGLIAGVNALRQVRGQDPLVLDRAQAYIGVMIDDLVTLGTREPYRMFTSRAERRLILREDNADLRLRPIGRDLGLVSDAQWRRFEQKRDAIDAELNRLKTEALSPSPELAAALAAAGGASLSETMSLSRLLSRPEVGHELIARFAPPPTPLSFEEAEEVEIMVKYEGYIRRELAEVQTAEALERALIPDRLDYARVPGLSNEIREKLTRVRPRSLGQARRVPGVTPAAIAALQIHLKAHK